MYFPYFIAYMLAGFIISLAVLFWALRHGQFQDQERLRYLPLADRSHPSAIKAGRLNRLEGYLMLGLACAGLMCTAAVLFFTLWRWR
jgi:cbb3-type cytochrome oxidase maturation protein